MQLDRTSARAGYIAGRRSIIAEAEALRDEMAQHIATLRADYAATFRQLQAARDELHQTRMEFLNFRAAVTRDKETLADICRQRAEIAFLIATRSPDTPLN